MKKNEEKKMGSRKWYLKRIQVNKNAEYATQYLMNGKKIDRKTKNCFHMFMDGEIIFTVPA